MSYPDEKKTGWGVGTSLKAYRGGARLFGGGIQLAAAIVLFLYVGRWIDEKLGTSPWCMIVGVLAGAGGGLYKLIKTAIEVGDESARQEKDNEKH